MSPASSPDVVAPSTPLPHAGGRALAGVLGAAIAPAALSLGLPGGIVATLAAALVGGIVAVLAGVLLGRLGVPLGETAAAFGFALGVLGTLAVLVVLGLVGPLLLGPLLLEPSGAAALLVAPVAAVAGPVAALLAAREPAATARRRRGQAGVVVVGTVVVLALVSPLTSDAQADAEHRSALASEVVAAAGPQPRMVELEGFEPRGVSVEHSSGLSWVQVSLRPVGSTDGTDDVQMSLHAGLGACEALQRGRDGVECVDGPELGIETAGTGDDLAVARSYGDVAVVLSGGASEAQLLEAVADASPVGVADVVALCHVFVRDDGSRVCTDREG